MAFVFTSQEPFLVCGVVVSANNTTNESTRIIRKEVVFVDFGLLVLDRFASSISTQMRLCIDEK